MEIFMDTRQYDVAFKGTRSLFDWLLTGWTDYCTVLIRNLDSRLTGARIRTPHLFQTDDALYVRCGMVWQGLGSFGEHQHLTATIMTLL